MTNREIVLLARWGRKLIQYLPDDADFQSLRTKVAEALPAIVQKRDVELVAKWNLRNVNKSDRRKRLDRIGYEQEFTQFLNEQSPVVFSPTDTLTARSITIPALMLYSGDFPEV